MTKHDATDTVPAARTARAESGSEASRSPRPDGLARIRTRKTMGTRAISSPRQTATAAP